MKSLKGNNWEIQSAVKFESSSLLKDLTSVLAANRGVDDVASFIYPEFERDLHDPILFRDAKKAVTRVKKALENRERILLFGDYDADGITATALLYDLLSMLDADVSYRLPHRINDGYGFKPLIVEEAKKKGCTLIITADCGVSNVDSVELAKTYGIDVIVTDHHTLPDKLPDACAILHPKLPDSKYPYDGLCGAGVAYKLCHLLLDEYSDEKTKEHWLKWALDLVAIGTVADCSDLLGENRALVKYGLKVLPKTRRIGLRKLYEKAGITEESHWDSTTIGYRIAPRLNAAGRLEDPETALALLVTKDEEEAEQLAEYLHSLNMKRQSITESFFKDTIKTIDYDNLPPVICIYDSKIPVGIIGLIAGKLSNEINVPVVIMTLVKDTVVGSVRSIKEVDIMEYLPELDDNFDEYGGHAQAAGFSTKVANVENIQKRLYELLNIKMKKLDTVRKLIIDCSLSLNDLSFDLFQIIENFSPYGIGNREPLFVTHDVSMEMLKIVGSNSQHLKCTLRQGNISFSGICFNAESIISSVDHTKSYDVVYRLIKNFWNGKCKLELQIMDLKLVS